MKYIKSIKNLRAVLDDENCGRINSSTIKGYIGELIVKDKLESENIGEIKHKGNQSGYDLEIIGKNIKIDVKFSLYKAELNKYKNFKNWGWALKFARNENNELKCTHFICVAINEKFQVEHYYVINAKNINKFKQTGIKQFKNVIRGFSLTRNNMKRQIPEELTEYFNDCKKLLAEKIVLKVRPSEKLSKYLIQ